MAKSNRSKPQGQAQPEAERAASSAVRTGEDDKAGWGGRPTGDDDVVIDGGWATGFDDDPGPRGDSGYRKSTGERVYRKWGDTEATLFREGRYYGPWLPEPGHDQSSLGCIARGNTVGVEAGSSDGESKRKGAETKGGERTAGVSDGGAGKETCHLCTESNDYFSDYHRGVHWTKSERITRPQDTWTADAFVAGCEFKERETKKRARRWVAAAALVGIALGLLLSAAYRVVLGS